jgi:uncharacterized protein (UPF0303 family)
MDIATLQAEAAELVFARFDETTAIELGMAIVTLARADGLPVVVNIRTADRTLFHAALPGAGGINDNWARRKSNLALMFRKASLLVGLTNQHKDQLLSVHGLDSADYAPQGGAVPIVVRGVGMVAVATVSGLTEVEDHALVARAIRAQIGKG